MEVKRLERGMYVRCPVADFEDPRNFITGKIIETDDFTENVSVAFLDPFGFRNYYENIPEKAELPYEYVKRCTLHRESYVMYRGGRYTILSTLKEDEWYYYYLKEEFTDKVIKVREDAVDAPFNGGRISPAEQLRSYEFQNPAWYFGRSIVSKTVKVLDNSVFGFKELAGCKIFLKEHQLKTIMRCLQEKNCRVMLADEVGMGKTIEAASVLKVYLLHNSNKKILIAVPRPLVAQWRTELLIKFEIIPGQNINDNYVQLIAEEDIENHINTRWDFVIADEAHKLLANRRLYTYFHSLSKRTENILLLSETPVQQKKEAYLELLQLIMPDKYDQFSPDDFQALVDKQKSITKSTYLVLQDFDDYIDNIADAIENGENPSHNEECTDLFDDVINGLKRISKLIEDDGFKSILSEIDIDSADYGKSAIQEALLYICENYQLEKNIIRNRRRYMEEDLPKRTVREIEYTLNPDKNTYEHTTYQAIVDWISGQEISSVDFEKYYIPLLTAFFSSSWAFNKEIQMQKNKGLAVDPDVEENAKEWLNAEEWMLKELDNVLAEPYNYSSRILSIVDFIDQEIYGEKVVVFTNYAETFEKYGHVLQTYFGEEKIALFNKNMDEEELELSIYRFQNEDECKILLCDETGGEGRNLQGADFVIHIDLPWDANAIEQRIGRLDRLGRPVDKDVCSVVIYAKETLEEELYNFWNKGLNIFTKSLSGLEIIMNEINESIIHAVTSDFRYGISNAISEIIESSQKMEKEVREEQHFDSAAFIYATLNQELKRLLRYYTSNENELFANTMMGWASLAGLKGHFNKDGIVRFNESSFSIKSAENSMLIPPNWMEYINRTSNAFSRRIRELYEERTGKKDATGSREIVGTFNREIAIENDYLHFFAPGDEVFDCIVDNAMNSYKGTCTAIALEADFEWRGIVYTWNLYPNEQILLEKGIPLTAIRQYKSYISVDQISTAISTQKYEHVPVDKVLKLLETISKDSTSHIQKDVVHLGRRTAKTDSLHIKERYGCANIDWFRQIYPEDKWASFVSTSMKMAKNQVKEKMKASNNLKLAAASIEQTLNAEVAQAKFFGVDVGEIEQKKQTYETVLEALRTTKVELEAAAFVMVRKTHD